MKVGERGQVTIPKEIRDRFGITAETEVEFLVEQGEIIVRKVAAPLALAKWKGFCGDRFRDLGLSSIDAYIDEVRGR
ncbi:MAG: AbrB/MazE/SpoVT family DNA-binding domain-containing protein [Bryobacteraceae bacterium]